MNNINYTVERLSKPKGILTFFLIFLVILSITNYFKPEFSYLTQTFNYSPEDVYSLLTSIGKTGRNNHLLVFISDILMVICYSVFLMGANYRLYRPHIKNCVLISVITFLPVLLALFQLSEIIGLFFLIIEYPTKLLLLANVTNVLTIIKYIFTIICFLLPIIGLGVTIILKIFKGDKNESNPTVK